MTQHSSNMRKSNIDTHYKPFPAFSEWQSLVVDNDEWERLKDVRNALLDADSSLNLNATTQQITRMAAYDTGALEQLYETDRDITYSFATSVYELNTELDYVDKVEAEKIRFVKSQLEAYELTLDAVTKKTPISEAWLRLLHETICASQDTYTALTALGKREVVLTKGQYKKYPNHVLLANGTFFAYAPVQETEHEVRRLIEELRSDAFQAAHPILQSAYAHYALVRIHLFADGNGRVCRVLASLYLYRDCSIPLLIFADQRSEYLAALRQADMGDFQEFVDFVWRCSRETIQIQERFIEQQLAPTVDASLLKIRETIRQSHYPYHEINQLVTQLQGALKEIFDVKVKTAQRIDGIQIRVEKTLLLTEHVELKHLRPYSEVRLPIMEGEVNFTQSIVLKAQSTLGDGVSLTRYFVTFIETGSANDPRIWVGNTGYFESRLSEIKFRRQSFTLKLQMWANSQISMFMDDFADLFSEHYSNK